MSSGRWVEKFNETKREIQHKNKYRVGVESET